MFVAMLAAFIVHADRPHFLHEYTLPLGTYPLSIVPGPDGALWFTTYPYFTNHPPINLGIARITTAGKVTYYHFENGTYDITPGSDGKLWFTNPYQTPYSVGSITTSGTIAQFNQASNGLPESIVTGPDNNLWYTSFGGTPDIVRITTGGKLVAGYQSSTFAARLGRGRDFVWFDMPARVGRISMGGAVTERSIGGPTYIPEFMALDPDGRMWECDGTYLVALARLNMAPTFYALPSKLNGTYGLTDGPDGSLWATDFDQGAIIRITPAGKITWYDIPTSNMVPSGITVGPDGNIWFTEIQMQTDVAKIGVLAP